MKTTMPIPTAPAREESGRVLALALIAAGILLPLLLCALAAPPLFRLLLFTLWLNGLASTLPPQPGRRLRLGALLALLLLALHQLFAPLLPGLIASAPPGSAAPALHGDAALISRHLAAGRSELLRFARELTALLWPSTATLALALLLAGLLTALRPPLHRELLRLAPNRALTRRAWLLRELPDRFGRWIRDESLRSLLMGGLWALGTWLLGYSHPAAAGLFMALAAPTPFWGPLFAAGLSLFFALDPGHLPLQAGGAAIVFAVTWLAAHLLLTPRLALSRPPLSRGWTLLWALAGYLCAGVGGFFIAAPLITAARHADGALHLPTPRSCEPTSPQSVQFS